MRKFTACKPWVLVALARGIATLLWTSVLRGSETKPIRIGVSPPRDETTSAGRPSSNGPEDGEEYQAPSDTAVKGTVEQIKATQPAGPPVHQSRAIRIGVLAKRGGKRCLQKWEPTAKYLTKVIPAYSFRIVPLGYDDLSSTVSRGDVDFVLANSAFYVQLEVLYGVSRMATLKNLHPSGPSTVYGGVIFCKASREDIKSFGDLKGKTFMSVDEDAFASWRTTCLELKEHGIDPYRDFSDLRFQGPMDAVVYAVRDGEVDAGAVRTDLLERMAFEGSIRLEDFRVFHDSHEHHLPAVLHSTPAYPEWPFAKVVHTSDELAEAVAVALIQMQPEAQAAEAARCAGWTIPLNYQPVHDCLKALRVAPYDDYGKVTLRAAFREYWPWFLSPLAALALVFACRQAYTNRRLKQAVLAQSEEMANRERAEEAARIAQQRFVHQQRNETQHVKAELDKTRQQLINQTRLASVGQVAASIAHELRNPLGAARNAAFYLKRYTTRPEPDLMENLGIIEEEINAADRIITNLMNMTRSRPLVKEGLDFGHMVEEVLQRVGLPDGIRCQVTLDPDPLTLDADPSQLRQVIGNLITNATQALEGTGEIAIEARRAGACREIMVRDSGAGVAVEHRDRLFEPLFTTRAKGTGLGLTICRDIIERHGGTIELVDEDQPGTAFCIRLPRQTMTEAQ